MSHALTLINAIQTCDRQQLRRAIRQVQAQAALDDANKKRRKNMRSILPNYINDKLAGALDVTALHVAAKAYSQHAHIPHLARVFNEMVSDLLEAGASPGATVGARYQMRQCGAKMLPVCVDPGQTVAQVCGCNMPPSLANWFALQVNDNLSEAAAKVARHEATRKWEQQRVNQFRRRLGRNSQLPGAMGSNS